MHLSQAHNAHLAIAVKRVNSPLRLIVRITLQFFTASAVLSLATAAYADDASPLTTQAIGTASATIALQSASPSSTASSQQTPAQVAAQTVQQLAQPSLPVAAAGQSAPAVVVTTNANGNVQLRPVALSAGQAANGAAMTPTSLVTTDTLGNAGSQSSAAPAAVAADLSAKGYSNGSANVTGMVAGSNGNTLAAQSLAASPDAAAPAATGSFLAGVASKAGDVVVGALNLIGVRYHWGGDTPDSGLDCSGFVRYVFQDTLNFTLPRRAVDMSRVGEKVSLNELKPGDLVFFNTVRRAVSHVGIYIGHDKFVHSPSTGSTIRVDEMSDRYWETRFRGARRLSVANDGSDATDDAMNPDTLAARLQRASRLAY